MPILHPRRSAVQYSPTSHSDRERRRPGCDGCRDREGHKEEHRADEELVRTNWLVKGEYSVFLVSWCPADDGNEVINIGITEPSVVRASRTWFLEIWQGLGRQSWDKRTVQQWLSRQVDELQSRVDGDHAGISR